MSMDDSMAMDQTIIVEVQGGLVHDVRIPHGIEVEVEIRNFDVEDADEDEWDRVECDETGQQYTATTYYNNAPLS